MLAVPEPEGDSIGFPFLASEKRSTILGEGFANNLSYGGNPNPGEGSPACVSGWQLPESRRQPEPVREPPLQYWDLDRANVLRDIQHLDEWILANGVIHGADEAVNPGPLPCCVFGDDTSHRSKFPSIDAVGTVP